MGRSVSYPSYTLIKAFQNVSDIDDAWGWQDFEEWLTDAATTAWPSLYPCDEWLGREDRALLKNEFVHFGVSEYMGLACIWIAERGDCEKPELARQWAANIASRFQRMFAEYRHIGSASNGEAFYERI